MLVSCLELPRTFVLCILTVTVLSLHVCSLAYKVFLPPFLLLTLPSSWLHCLCSGVGEPGNEAAGLCKCCTRPHIKISGQRHTRIQFMQLWHSKWTNEYTGQRKHWTSNLSVVVSGLVRLPHEWNSQARNKSGGAFISIPPVYSTPNSSLTCKRNCKMKS